MTRILLASSSPYRRQLLDKLGLCFDHASPNTDETPQINESPYALAERLSIAKAEALSTSYPDHLIIGSDQVAELNGKLLGKPGCHANAVDQLSRCSGNTVTFYTGICLRNTKTGRNQYQCDTYTVIFRHLTLQQIEHYVTQETPYDCAGSFKSEGLGISLFAAIKGEDPNSLVGLPLIKLTQMLLNEGVDVLSREIK